MIEIPKNWREGIIQGAAFNVTHFESRIKHLIVHSNKYN
jgi:hypothetical protein